MEATTKKSPAMKAESTGEKTKTIKPVKAKKTTNVHDRISKLEMAYMEALNGKIKFGEVKTMFKKIHREIKSSSKK